MALISLEEVKPGLILEKNIQNAHGQLLVAAGTALTERHLTLLRSWGVTQVAVTLTGDIAKKLTENTQISEASREKASTALQDLFYLALSDDPIMQEIYRQCVARKAKALS